MTIPHDWQSRAIALVALGPEEAEVARYLAARLPGASLHVHASATSTVHTDAIAEAVLGSATEAAFEASPTTATRQSSSSQSARVASEQRFDKTAQCLSDLFAAVQGIVVVAPIGVTVRSLAPLLRSKLTDPAVVAVDALGRYAVSLLSGHEGGANELSLVIADLLDAQPVVTTTTEAKKKHVIGIGCRRGVSAHDIVAAIRAALDRNGLELDTVRWLATAEIKRNEAGLHEAARALHLPLRFVRVEQLRRWALTESALVRSTFDVPAVAEPAALFCGTRTRCLMPKTVFHPGITLSIAEERLPWSGSDPDPARTEPTAPNEPFDLPT